jgi:hypothetical protein
VRAALSTTDEKGTEGYEVLETESGMSEVGHAHAVKLGRGIEMHVRPDELTPAAAEAVEANPKPSSATKVRPKARRKGRNAAQESDLLPGSGAGLAAIQFKSNTADLRGMRVDDALGVLDNALNRMVNSGTQVSGNGSSPCHQGAWSRFTVRLTACSASAWRLAAWKGVC